MSVTTALTDYTAAIAYIENLISRPISSREQAGLARVETLLAAVGHPERAFAAVQVAGTTGKGSTTTMIAAVLRQAGYHTGSFTSPHLQSYRERIAIDGMPIDEEAWVRLLNRLLPILARMEQNDLPGYDHGRAAFLDVLWTMACLAFAERGVRCAAVETGLGGRLDPTTANTAAVAAITNVSLDHMERLGSSVQLIAAEKAGLIKPGQIVVSAASPEPLAVIRATCAERDATLWTVGSDGAVRVEPPADLPMTYTQQAPLTDPFASFAIQTPLRRHEGLRLGLRGAHQRINAACAVGAIDALVQQTGIAIPETAVIAGLAAARIPGRLEVISGQPEILLDGAHNAAGAEALADALRAYYPQRRIVLVLGILGDKDYRTITNLLAPLAAAVVVAEPPWKSRAGFAEIVADLARQHVATVEVAPEPAAALTRARALAGNDDLVLVAGSLYLVGAIRDVLLPLITRAHSA